MKKNKLSGIGAIPQSHVEPPYESPDHENSHEAKLEKHEIDRHIGSLMEAEKIKGDAKLMKALQPHIEKHKEAAAKVGAEHPAPVKSIAQLKEKAKQKMSEPG